MEGCSMDICDDSDELSLSILTVLRVDMCAQAILDLVPVRDLVRSQRVCRQWEGIVHHYLRACRSLSFHYVLDRDDLTPNYVLDRDDLTPSYATKPSIHRRIEISPKDHPLLLASKIVEKWGPSIVELNTGEYWHDEYDKKQYRPFLKIVTSKCPYLRKIKMFVTHEEDLNKLKKLKYLRHVSLVCFTLINVRLNKNIDQLLANLFQILECEAITIVSSDSLKGSFLNSINCNKLKSLYIRKCHCLNVSEMLPAVEALRNITTLHVDDSDTCETFNVHLLTILFKEMPQLEELSLRQSWIGDVSSESFSELVNLKRLYMENSDYVNDTLLKALARGCKKLECLDIRGSAREISVNGLAALCQRTPTARTSLHFGVPRDKLDDHRLQIYFGRFFKNVEVFEDLAVLGCVEMTLEWFSAACRDPRGRQLLLNRNLVQAESPQLIEELKIILFDDTYSPSLDEFI